jgi:hypothetical protein
MEISQALDTPSKSWPPERGWPLFLAWVGGVLAVSLLYAVISFAVPYRPQIGNWNDRILWALPALAGHAWQAWLLFRKYPVRFGLWTALPVLQFVIPDPIRFMSYLSLVIPLAEAAILRNIRQRAWAWILASMAGVVLSSVFFQVVYNVARAQFNDLMNGFSGKLGMQFSSLVQSGLSRGVWLLGEVICAAVLAWKMPLVKQASGTPEREQTSGNSPSH